MAHVLDKREIKVVVIGFDGATFDVLDPLIEQGKLPHFALLLRDGVSARLKSTIPPLSGPAWATFQTGLNPGKHGAYDFLRNIPENYGCIPINKTLFPSKSFWEILSDYGKRVGVMNVLFNYPPKELNGFIVSGKETPGEDKPYSYPPSLKEEILSYEPKYEVEPFKRISKNKTFLREVIEKLEQQERVNTYLFKKYPCEFFMSFYAVPDVIQHVFWAYLDPSHPNFRAKIARKYGPLIEKCYQAMDRIIGKQLETIDDNTILIIMSDHGAGPVHKILQLDKWLQDQGLMVLREQEKNKVIYFSLSIIKRLIYYMINLGETFDVFGLKRFFGFKTRERRRAFSRNTLIDWSRTKAYSGRVSEYGIHINLKGREGKGIVEPEKEYESIRELIITNLLEVKDPQTGERVFKKIWKREEIFEGPYLSYAPDLILEFGDYPYLIADSLISNKLFTKVPSKGLGGKHRDYGILLAKGKGICKNKKIDGVNICDLAPTILFAMDIPIPEDMDGEVITDLFDFPIDKESIPKLIGQKKMEMSLTESKEVIYSDEDTEEIVNRLKGLGYL